MRIYDLQLLIIITSQTEDVVTYSISKKVESFGKETIPQFQMWKMNWTNLHVIYMLLSAVCCHLNSTPVYILLS